MWLGKYPEAEERGGTVYNISSFVVSSLPSCPSSLPVLPPCMSIDEAELVLLYLLLGNFLSIVEAVHSASPPPPSLHVLPLLVLSLPSCPPSFHVIPPFVSFLPSCPSSHCALPPFMSFLPSCPSVRQSLFFSAYSSAMSSPLLGQSIMPLPLLSLFVSFLPSSLVSSLPSCPAPSLCVLPPFVSFLPLCPSSLHVHR